MVLSVVWGEVLGLDVGWWVIVSMCRLILVIWVMVCLNVVDLLLYKVVIVLGVLMMCMLLVFIIDDCCCCGLNGCWVVGRGLLGMLVCFESICSVICMGLFIGC